jgi:hypothetical protein
VRELGRGRRGGWRREGGRRREGGVVEEGSGRRGAGGGGGCRRKRSLLNFRQYPRICLKGLTKTTKTSEQLASRQTPNSSITKYEAVQFKYKSGLGGQFKDTETTLPAPYVTHIGHQA